LVEGTVTVVVGVGAMVVEVVLGVVVTVVGGVVTGVVVAVVVGADGVVLAVDLQFACPHDADAVVVCFAVAGGPAAAAAPTPHVAMQAMIGIRPRDDQRLRRK
jgi:hypothetical protein